MAQNWIDASHVEWDCRVDEYFKIRHTNITKPILLQNNHIAIRKQLIQNNGNKVNISLGK